MNAWNDTKAINFKQVTDYRKANIIVNAGNYSNTGWYHTTACCTTWLPLRFNHFT